MWLPLDVVVDKLWLYHRMCKLCLLRAQRSTAHDAGKSSMKGGMSDPDLPTTGFEACGEYSLITTVCGRDTNVIGSGRYGLVMSGRHSTTGRVVAIKVCNDLTDNSSFASEIRILKLLHCLQHW